ncbi:AI-2E family transporter [Aurantiacibacter aquimixticola]|uniref:AI-2E family transporter n=1 Tax=Aurantiacibacter aquimixticola TaxID=1958945 RepID=A0A419RQC3_9SPHN|nr:AI-2E family transporter [Aurantiacibacter aquimixticola]RJY07993.1 AI-2E family transporter [Aurantiacibacter aquimixticola]
MSDAAEDDENIGASPARISTPELRFEAARAFVWVCVIGAVALAVYISESLLVIFGAMVFAAMVDGGARLLGRALPIARGWRVSIVLLAVAAFLVWLGFFAGSQISQQAAEFPDIINRQIGQTIGWLREQGFAISQADVQGLASQLASGAGAISRAIGGAIGGLTTVALIVIIGIYLAAEPRLYERGVRWMVPRTRRGDLNELLARMGTAMRRLMAGRLVGMTFEGIFTYIMLMAYGWVTGDVIPMAALLAILTGLLAFVPNIGAIISGVLMVLVGFSGGTQMGIYTIVVYFLVQNIDGYLVIPMIAKKTVDLAPALVLAFQLIMGILFGILGLFLADPLLAMIKVALEHRARAKDAEDEANGVTNRPETKIA